MSNINQHDTQQATQPTDSRVVTMRLDWELLAFIDRMTKTLGWSKSDTIRAALRMYENWINTNPGIVLDYLRTQDKIGG